MLAYSGRHMRPVVIAVAAASGGFIGFVNPLWGGPFYGIRLIFVNTVFIVVPTIGAWVKGDGNRVRAGLIILAVTWTAFILVSVLRTP
jgi:hypothetical protein